MRRGDRVQQRGRIYRNNSHGLRPKPPVSPPASLAGPETGLAEGETAAGEAGLVRLADLGPARGKSGEGLPGLPRAWRALQKAWRGLPGLEARLPVFPDATCFEDSKFLRQGPSTGRSRCRGARWGRMCSRWCSAPRGLSALSPRPCCGFAGCRPCKSTAQSSFPTWRPGSTLCATWPISAVCNVHRVAACMFPRPPLASLCFVALAPRHSARHSNPPLRATATKRPDECAART